MAVPKDNDHFVAYLITIVINIGVILR